MIRKPASFMSSICDDRGQELLYAGMAITDVIKEDIGIGGVLSLLWFRKRLVESLIRSFLFIFLVLLSISLIIDCRNMRASTWRCVSW